MPRQIPIDVAPIVLDYMTDEQLYHLLKQDGTAPSGPKSPCEIEWQNRILLTLFRRHSDSALDYQKKLVLTWPKNKDTWVYKQELLRVLDDALKEPHLCYQHKLLYCYFISLISTQKTALIRDTIQSLEIKLQRPTTAFNPLSRLQLEVLGPEISNDLIEQALTQLSWLFSGWTEQLLLLPFHCQRYIPSMFYIYYLPILQQSSQERCAALTLLGSLAKIATQTQRDRIIAIILSSLQQTQSSLHDESMIAVEMLASMARQATEAQARLIIPVLIQKLKTGSMNQQFHSWKHLWNSVPYVAESYQEQFIDALISLPAFLFCFEMHHVHSPHLANDRAVYARFSETQLYTLFFNLLPNPYPLYSCLAEIASHDPSKKLETILTNFYDNQPNSTPDSPTTAVGDLLKHSSNEKREAMISEVLKKLYASNIWENSSLILEVVAIAPYVTDRDRQTAIKFFSENPHPADAMFNQAIKLEFYSASLPNASHQFNEHLHFALNLLGAPDFTAYGMKKLCDLFLVATEEQKKSIIKGFLAHLTHGLSLSGNIVIGLIKLAAPVASEEQSNTLCQLLRNKLLINPSAPYLQLLSEVALHSPQENRYNTITFIISEWNFLRSKVSDTVLFDGIHTVLSTLSPPTLRRFIQLPTKGLSFEPSLKALQLIAESRLQINYAKFDRVVQEQAQGRTLRFWSKAEAKDDCLTAVSEKPRRLSL